MENKYISLFCFALCQAKAEAMELKCLKFLWKIHKINKSKVKHEMNEKKYD